MNKTKTAFMLMCLLMMAATGYSQHPLVYKTINEAAEKGDLADVTRHLERGADVNARTEYGDTPLTMAAGQGHLEVVKFLVSQGADINAGVRDFTTPLMFSALDGNLDVAKFLVSQGADINAKNKYGWTPLLCAAMQGHLEAAKFLVSKGAPVNAKDQNGNTPLKWAEHKGHQDVVNYLGAKGAGMDMYQQVVSEMYNAAFNRLMRKKNMMTHEKFNKAWSSLEKKRDEAIRKSTAANNNMVATINGGKSAGNAVYQSREPDSANTIVTFSPFGSATDDDELQAEINTRRQANQAWQINENETQAILNRQRNENETQANQARQRHEAESRARERESKQWQLSQKASRLESDIDRASFSRSQGDLGKLSRKASSLSREASMHGYMSAASKFRKAANELDRQDFKDRFPSQSTDPFAVNRAKESVTSGRSSLNSFDNNSFSK